MTHFYGRRAPVLDRSLVAITRAANYTRLWLAIAGGLALCGGPRGRRAAGHGVIALAIAAAVANGPAKLLVRRRRPFHPSQPALIHMPRSTSFPSGHSAAAFAFATAASAELPALAPVLLPLAAAVAYSRVHLGVHYPSDAVAGAAAQALTASVRSQHGALQADRWRSETAPERPSTATGAAR